jgi:hypothetical protein
MLFIVNWLNCSNDNQAILSCFLRVCCFLNVVRVILNYIPNERGSERRISLLRQAIFLLHRKRLFSWSLLRHHYIKNGFLVDHYYDNQNIEKNIKIKTFDVLIFPMASKKITTSKIKNIFLSNYLWHITYGYQDLWGPGGLC